MPATVPTADAVQLSLSHLGYLPDSPKTLTLIASDTEGLPDSIPFYIRQNCIRMPRDAAKLEGFSERFPAPYDLLRGKLIVQNATAPLYQGTLYQGTLMRQSSRWGTCWQADFTDFQAPGSYQIETDWQISAPFAIREHAYDRIILGYLNFLRGQRCGTEVFGVHEPCHLDDGILDTDGSAIDATGGWHDAGDFRKWLAFTLRHLEALLTVHTKLGTDLERGGILQAAVLDEVAWGNAFFQRMMSAEGQVYEDVAGGSAPPGTSFTYEDDWWFENHPGCFGDASDNRWTDNLPASGDERKVRTTYNPLVQWTFVQVQALAAQSLPSPQNERCLALAQKAADFAERHPHDQRTLFLAAELRGRLELLTVAPSSAQKAQIASLAKKLLERQAMQQAGLSGYFLEANTADAFRSIAFNADPAFALLRLWEMRRELGDTAFAERARHAVSAYIDNYLLVDAASNPFGVTPYGVFLNPAHADRQLFRDAGEGHGVRTFMHPFNQQGIVHGTSSVLMSHAHLLAKAATLFARPEWRAAAERLLHWCLGHNTLNRSLFNGIGYRQPVGYSYRIPQLPEAMVVGFIGRPEDTPYLEESTAIEWNTLEYWSVPYLHAAQAACWLHT